MKPLEKIDRMMWETEHPDSPVTISGMMILEKKISQKKLIDTLENRLLRFDRFRQKISIKNNTPYWEDDAAFNIKNHLFFADIDTNQPYKILQQQVSRLMSEPLDYTKPLWDAHIYNLSNGQSAIVFRLHHAIADGVALIRVLFSLTGESSKASIEKIEKSKGFSWKSIPLIKQIKDTYDSGEKVIQGIKNTFRNPEIIKEQLGHLSDVTKDVMSIFTDKDITGSFYKGEFSDSKIAAWSVPVDLITMKKLGKKYGATLNDVLLALMTGAVRKHLTKHKQPVNDGLRIVIPVNIRDMSEEIVLHNEIGFISLELPVHLKNFKSRLKYINVKTSLLKNSPEPLLLSKLMEIVADYLSKDQKNKFASFMATKIGAVITNVPGPRNPVYLSGIKVSDIYCWIPHTAPLGVGLSMLSYNNKVTTGMIIDRNMADDPDFLLNAFVRELESAKKILTEE
jgi:diacylglycerol O-acyltransferase / wax synthase